MRRYSSLLYIFILTLVALLGQWQALMLAYKQPFSLSVNPETQDYHQIQADRAIWLTAPSPDFSQAGAPKLVAPEPRSESYAAKAVDYSPCSRSDFGVTALSLGAPVQNLVQATDLPAWLRLTHWAFDSRSYKNYNILIWSPFQNVERYQLAPDWPDEDKPVKSLTMSDLPAVTF